MVKMICFLFFLIFRPLFRAVRTPDLDLGDFGHSGNADLGDFEAFLSEIGGPTSGSNLFWGVFGMG